MSQEPEMSPERRLREVFDYMRSSRELALRNMVSLDIAADRAECAGKIQFINELLFIFAEKP